MHAFTRRLAYAVYTLILLTLLTHAALAIRTPSPMALLRMSHVVTRALLAQ
jgi:hypothetical protein